MEMKRLLTISTIYFAATLSAYAQWAALFGSSVEGQTKLYIETRDWPQDLEGFIIKKRGADQSWEQLHPDPIKPQIGLDREWANSGLDEEQTARVMATLTEYLEQGKLKAFSEERMLSTLKKVGGLQSGDRLRMKADFQLALIMGFGFIDNQYEKDVDTEYGVFFVRSNGSIKDEALATYEPQPVELTFEPRFEKRAGTVRCIWEIDSASIANAGVFSFDLYRGKKADQVEKISDVSVIPASKSNGLFRYEYTDNSADPEEDHIYAIGVVNKFQEEIIRVEKEYEASLYKALLIPSLDTITIENDTQCRLLWAADWNRQDRERIEKVVIERSLASVIDFSQIGETSADSTAFTDSTALEYGSRYLYRLKVVGTEVEYGTSSTYNYLYLGSPQAKTPAFGQATFEVIDGGPYINLVWEARATDDSATVGYLIYSDELEPDEFLLLASVGTVTSNSHRQKIGRTKGRTYQFRIEPINEYGDRAPYLELSIDVDALLLPRPQNFSVAVGDKASLVASWSFPEEFNIYGFNVFMNGTMVADTSEVGKDLRSWRIAKPSITDDGMVKVRVEAIGILTTSSSLEKSLYLPRFRNASLVPPPENLEANLKKEKKLRFAELKWEAPETGGKAVIGYQLWVDESEEGYLIKQQKLVKTNELTYQLPDTKREAYTFRVAAVNEDRRQGPPAEVILALKKKKRE